MNSCLYHTDDTSAQEPGYGKMNQQVQTVWRGEHGPRDANSSMQASKGVKTTRKISCKQGSNMVGLTTGLLPVVSLQTVLQTCNTSRNISDLETQHRSKSPIIHTLVLQTLERITGNLKRSSIDYDCKRAATEKRWRNCAINWPNQRTEEKHWKRISKNAKIKSSTCSPNK